MINFKSKHPIVLLNFLPRVCGIWYVALFTFSCIYGQNRISVGVLLYLTMMLIWPFIALSFSYNSKNPKPLELNFILIDSMTTGIAMGMLGFSLWPAVTMWCSLMVGAVSLNGFVLGLKSLISVAVGVLISWALFGIYVNLHTDLVTTIICIIGLFTFTFVTGYMTYSRNRVGKKDRVKLRAALNELDHINKILHECSSSLKLDNVTHILVESLQTNVFNFDTLVMQSYDPEENVLKFKIIDDKMLSSVAYDSLRQIKLKLSDKSLAVDVFKSGAYQYVKELQFDDLLLMDKQIQSLIMCRSVIIFPLIIKNKAIGVMAFYSRAPLELDQKQIDTTHNYIKQVSLIINNAILHDQVRNKRLEISQKNKQLKSVSMHLAKYIPPQLFDKIMDGEVDFHVGAKKKMLTIFFSDIVSFTEMSDRMDSEKLTTMLNMYLDSMTKIALRYGGTIDKYIGDALMVFFGDPSTKGVKADACQCALMALEMRQKLSELRESWAKLGINEHLEVRIGMHTGFCAVGNFGSEFRMDYTIIGSSVNLASRLLTSGTPGQIVISEESYSLINDTIRCQENGLVRAKGFAQPVKTYEILDNITNKSEQELVINEKK